MILEKEVWVTLSSRVKYYEDLGYLIPKKIDKQGKLRSITNSKILVKVEDLPTSTHIRLTKVCDICGIHSPNLQLNNILRSRKNTDGNDRCEKCGQLYAVENYYKNIPYERTLENYAIKNNLIYLLDQYSNRNNKNPSEIAYASNLKCWWRCPDCESEYDMSVGNRTTKHKGGCPYCVGKRVNDTNSLWTTNPEVATLLKDKESGHKLTSGSARKEVLICPECTSENLKTIHRVVRSGFSCSICSDGLSYPEKFLISFLKNIGVDFETQKTFTWSKKLEQNHRRAKRYDAYIKQLHCIIEIHGRQHYDRAAYGKTLEEEQENDRIKELMAKENGIKHYIVIDARISNVEYIKNKIIESELNNLFDLSKVNWIECDRYACSSYVTLASEMWNSGVKSTKEISNIIKLSQSHVAGYLKKGTILGMCDYDPEEVKIIIAKRNAIHNKKRIVQLDVNDKVISIWDSITDACLGTGLGNSNISNVCTGRNLTAGGYKWMYKEDYEKLMEENVINV